MKLWECGVHTLCITKVKLSDFNFERLVDNFAYEIPKERLGSLIALCCLGDDGLL